MVRYEDFPNFGLLQEFVHKYFIRKEDIINVQYTERNGIWYLTYWKNI